MSEYAMKARKNSFNNLTRNLLRINSLNEYSKEHEYLTFPNGGHNEWLIEKFLPNTRLIIEPMISGFSFDLLYTDGILDQLFCRQGSGLNEANKVKTNVPEEIPINNKILIKVVLYKQDSFQSIPNESKSAHSKKGISNADELKYCGLRILNSDQNHSSQLLSLQSLGFNIVETRFTNFLSEVDFYLKMWREGKLFQKYPTVGILLRTNSRKLQKQLVNSCQSPNGTILVT
tara:strand:- start:1589 stop:2281 length:693 start_codon:yes stop_codon:yes gene_type:complete